MFLTQIRIVHVGGSEADQRALETVLRDAGFAGVRFLMSAEALDETMAHRVDVLIVDLMQPSQDVLALMRAGATAKGDGRQIPVIVAAPVDPQPMIKLEHNPAELTTRIIDILCPVGFGQRSRAQEREEHPPPRATAGRSR